MFWKFLTREHDLLAIVKETDNLKQLVSLKNYLSSEVNTMTLRDGTVHKALMAVEEKLELKEIGIKEILDLLL
jgi:hypothetical protein